MPRLSAAPAVHPHARGEHALSILSRKTRAGSSPRTWGTHRPRHRAGRPVRFIPTHVGNTHLRHRAHAGEPVHPHARGEHAGQVPSDALAIGSSPRTWGTPYFIHRHRHLARFIPTHVGNTPGLEASRRARSVHPHARGEHLTRTRGRAPWCGSSPRTWGTLNRTPFGGRQEATMSVIHGRPVRSLATNREPAVGG